jgi:hypothetical protein
VTTTYAATQPKAMLAETTLEEDVEKDRKGPAAEPKRRK